MPTLVELLENLMVFIDEKPVGTIDSSNTSYALTQSPLGDSTQVFLNGVHLIPSGDSAPVFDYTIDDRNIEFTSAPLAGSVVTTKYVVAAALDLNSQFMWNENLGFGDGSTTEYLVSNPPVVNSTIDIYLDGAHQTLNVDYALNFDQTGVIFTVPPFDGSSITTNYRFPVVP